MKPDCQTALMQYCNLWGLKKKVVGILQETILYFFIFFAKMQYIFFKKSLSNIFPTQTFPKSCVQGSLMKKT